MQTYIVKKGDRTTKIAELHGVPQEALVAANARGRKVGSHNGRPVLLDLRVGEKLHIPDKAVHDPGLADMVVTQTQTPLGPSGPGGFPAQQKSCAQGMVFVQLTPSEGACVINYASLPQGTPLPQGPCPMGHVPALIASGPRAGQYACVNANYPGMPRPSIPANTPAPEAPPTPTMPGWPDPTGLLPGLPGVPSGIPGFPDMPTGFPIPGFPGSSQGSGSGVQIPTLSDFGSWPGLTSFFPSIPASPTIFDPVGAAIDAVTGLPIQNTTPGTTLPGAPTYDPRLFSNGAIPSGTVSPEGAGGFLPSPAPPPACSAVWGPEAFPLTKEDGFVYCAICDGADAVYDPKLGYCVDKPVPGGPPPGPGGSTKPPPGPGGGTTVISPPPPRPTDLPPPQVGSGDKTSQPAEEGMSTTGMVVAAAVLLGVAGAVTYYATRKE